MRDIHTNVFTTPQHFEMFRSPWNVTSEGMSFPYVVGEGVEVNATVRQAFSTCQHILFLK